MLFAESEWAVRVIDIRQASVISLGGLRLRSGAGLSTVFVLSAHMNRVGDLKRV